MTTAAPETIYVDTKRLSCDGGGGALGHPRVYLEMGGDDKVECPYCDRLYIYDPKKSAEAKAPASASRA